MPPSEEFGCQCELLYEFGINDINSIPNSSKLRDDFDRIMQDALNKLKLEFLEVNVRRLEFRKEVSELDHKLETNKNVDMGSLRRIFFVKEPVKVKNEQLNTLLTECDNKIVELSNIFLSEKIELIFRHNKQIETLNKQINELKAANLRYLKMQQISDKSIEEIELKENESQTDLNMTKLNELECAFRSKSNSEDSVSIHTQTSSNNESSNEEKCDGKRRLSNTSTQTGDKLKPKGSALANIIRKAIDNKKILKSKNSFSTITVAVQTDPVVINSISSEINNNYEVLASSIVKSDIDSAEKELNLVSAETQTDLLENQPNNSSKSNDDVEVQVLASSLVKSGINSAKKEMSLVSTETQTDAISSELNEANNDLGYQIMASSIVKSGIQSAKKEINLASIETQTDISGTRVELYTDNQINKKNSLKTMNSLDLNASKPELKLVSIQTQTMHKHHETTQTQSDMYMNDIEMLEVKVIEFLNKENRRTNGSSIGVQVDLDVEMNKKATNMNLVRLLTFDFDSNEDPTKYINSTEMVIIIMHFLSIFKAIKIR